MAQARLAACSALIGLTTAAILLCSHFHSIDTDKAAKKMSPLVRLGTPQRGALVSLLEIMVAGSYSSLQCVLCVPFTLVSSKLHHALLRELACR